MDKVNVENLYTDQLNVTPVNKNWGEGFGVTWDFWDADECWECGEEVIGGLAPECPNCGTEQDSLEGPMMSYYYPLNVFGDFDPRSAARKILDLPLCVVEIYDDPMKSLRYGLALTGGGMDLSWEICEAFIRLGSLPPLHFARLPGMAGRGESERDRMIIEACKRSFKVEEDRSRRSREILEEEYNEL